MRVFTTDVFVRFVAANLSRKYRNDIVSARADAINQLAAIGGILVTCVFAIVVLVLSKPFLTHLYTLDKTFLVIFVTGSVVVALAIRRVYSNRSISLEDVEPYMTRNTVRTTNIIYVAVPLLAIWILGFLLLYADPP